MAKSRKKRFDVITIGGATRDIMFYSGEGELISTSSLTKQKLLAFEYGAKILADKLFFTYGGGAANSATTFSKLGLKTAIMSRIGDDENGKEIMNNLKANKIDTSFVRIDRSSATGFSMILTVSNAAKEHILFMHRGANDGLNQLDLVFNQAESDWFYVTSLPKNSWERIMKSVIAQDKNIVWNPGSQQLSQASKMKKFLPKIKALVLNRDEAMEFRKLRDTKGLLKYLFNLGPELVVITDGASGAYAYDGQKYYFMRAKAIKKAVDTVGVGDAFSAALTSGLIYGKNIRQCLKWGINNSASVLSKIGAQNGILTKRSVNK